MKKSIKKSLALILMAAMLIVSNICAFNASAASYKTGDIIEFGSYPQSRVTNSTLLNKLNKEFDWQTLPFRGDELNEFMCHGYADVTYEGEKYRAVMIFEYRGYYADWESDTEWGTAKDNGYNLYTVYWFKYEPLKWRVLDPATGLVMSEKLIDSQPFNTTSYYDSKSEDYYTDSSCQKLLNDYSVSAIRTWLNYSFYNSAFSTNEKVSVEKADILHKINGTQKYIKDNVFLLSSDDVSNPAYGFYASNDYTKPYTPLLAAGTDYAKIMGLDTSINYAGSSGFQDWILRSAVSKDWMPGAISCVRGDGWTEAPEKDGTCLATYMGIRPAIRIKNLNSSTTAAYTLTYNANGGSGAPSSQNGSASYTVSSAVPTRSGYTFLGWSTNKNATSASYTAGKSITLTANTTLYAVWQKNTATPPAEDETPVFGISLPSVTTINYGDTLVLKPVDTELPEGCKISWSVEGTGVTISANEDGTECRLKSTSSGTATVTATVVGENGDTVKNENGEEMSDEITITSKGGFFQKLISFFKNLFGLNRVIF